MSDVENDSDKNEEEPQEAEQEDEDADDGAAVADEEEEEEEVEEQITKKKKKKHNRLRMFEDEAEVSDDEDVSADEEVGSEDDIIAKELIDDSEDVVYRKKKKKGKRGRVEALTKDDFDLIEENTGIRYAAGIDDDVDEDDDTGPRKRLKKKKIAAEDERVEASADTQKELESSLFGFDDDDDIDNEKLPDEKEVDPFDTGSEEDDEANFIQDDYDDGGGRQEGAMSAVHEAFGDLSDFFRATGVLQSNQQEEEEELEEKEYEEDEGDEGDFDEDGADEGKRRDPKKKLTPAQKAALIDKTDVPERLQARAAKRIDYDLSEMDDVIEIESKWIWANAFSEVSEKITSVISTVLHYIRVEHLEVPFIQRYRREYWEIEIEGETKILTEEDLWTINDWDDKWVAMEARRARLERMATNLPEEDVNIIDFIRTANKEAELDWVQDYLKRAQLALGINLRSNQKEGSTKRASSHGLKSLHRVAEATGLTALVDRMGISARQFAENLQHGFSQHEPQDPEVDFIGMADEYISKALPDTENVVATVRHLAASKLVYDVFVRDAFSKTYLNRAVVCTKPTPKGVREINWTHEYYGVKRIENKPLSKFLSTTEQSGTKLDTSFIQIVKAQEEGYIKYIIKIPMPEKYQEQKGDLEDDREWTDADFLFDEFVEFYISNNLNSSAESWNTQRKLILQSAIRSLVRHTVKEMDEMLLATGRDLVVKEVVKSFHHLVTRAKYSGEARVRDHSRPDEDEFCIVACVLGGEEESTAFVLLNEYGDVVDYLSLDFLKSRVSARANSEGQRSLYARKKKDVKAFQAFLQTHNPSLIAIDASSLDVLDFRKDLTSQILVDFPNIRLELVDPRVGTIFMTSERAESEFKDYSNNFRMAISMGRCLLDPVSEMAGLWYLNADGVVNQDESQREILSLRLHPLQDAVPHTSLLRGFERCLVNLTNYSGVDINKIVNRPFLTYTTQFVAGLGPVKAKKLLDAVKRRGFLANRDGLSHEQLGVFDPCVYRNCAGFVFIRRNYAMTENNELTHDNLLDLTRIHPDNYVLANNVVLDALDVNLDDDEDEDDNDEQKDSDLVDTEKKLRLQQKMDKYIQTLMEPDHLPKLDELDFEKFAEMEEQDGHGKKLATLNLIKAELKAPFVDAKGIFPAFKSLDVQESFSLLTGESQSTLFVNQLVNVKVFHVNPNGVFSSLDSGIRGWIPIEYISSSSSINPRSDQEDKLAFIDDRIKQGQTIVARIRKIDLINCSVELTTRSDDLAKQNDLTYELQFDEYRKDIIDPQYCHRGVHEDDRKLLDHDKNDKNAKSFIPRSIVHPLFQNISREDAEKFLEDKPPGHVIIRPSSRGPTHITVTWKLSEDMDIFFHVNVTEEDKPENDPFALGAKLKIGEENFEDLDEVTARYIDPMVSLSNLMVEHKNFRFGDDTELFALLKDEKEIFPAKIPYLVSPMADRPGVFIFSYMPNTTVKKHYITLTPEGYRFQGRKYQQPKKVIDRLKAHIAHAAKHPHRQNSQQSQSHNSHQSSRHRSSKSHQQHHHQRHVKQERSSRHRGEERHGKGDGRGRVKIKPERIERVHTHHSSKTKEVDMEF